MILALVMALALVACGNKNTDDGNKDNPDDNKTPTVITNPDEVQDEMTSSDGKYEVAFVDVYKRQEMDTNYGSFPECQTLRCKRRRWSEIPPSRRHAIHSPGKTPAAWRAHRSVRSEMSLAG